MARGIFVDPNLQLLHGRLLFCVGWSRRWRWPGSTGPRCRHLVTSFEFQVYIIGHNNKMKRTFNSIANLRASAICRAEHIDGTGHRPLGPRSNRKCLATTSTTPPSPSKSKQRQRLSKMYLPTLKDNPTFAAESESHTLMLRAGLIRQVRFNGFSSKRFHLQFSKLTEQH